MAKPSFVYTSYINTTPEQLWKALTLPEFTQRYWNLTFESTWEVGAPITWNHDGVTIADPEQVVLESDPYRRLSYTWHSFTPEWAASYGFDEDNGARMASESRDARDLRPRARRRHGEADRRARRLRRRQPGGIDGE